ncbi:hypothetical protein XELAEV_18024156mg [Xenopus laevis]|uniref:Uncharacterized protein n=1 Tax=Xenopus laevis TaxID=8355 RepID=A0A974D803_XENLA|nr:hypothetical protein XELAEV_18024156mg [Xenopus laevis]
MGPPSVKKKQQIQTPPMFQWHATEHSQLPSLSPCTEHSSDPKHQVTNANTQARLQAVQKLFETEFTAAVTGFSGQIRELDDRLEYTAGGHAAALQEDQKHIASHQAQIAQLENKVEDLENRLQRGNLRARGVPETVTDVASLMDEVLHQLLPELLD